MATYHTIINPPIKHSAAYYSSSAWSSFTTVNYEDEVRNDGESCGIYEFDLGESNIIAKSIKLDITRTSASQVNVSLLLYDHKVSPLKVTQKIGALKEYVLNSEGRFEINFSDLSISGRYLYIGAMFSQINYLTIHGTEVTTTQQAPYIHNYNLNGKHDKYQDRTSPIVLTWDQYYPGVTVTHSDIQYALPSDYSTWIDIGTVQGDSTTYTIPANTFPAIAGTSTSSPYGGIKLRVIAYNINGIASNDGNYFAFVTVDSAIEVRATTPSNGTSADETKPILFRILTENSLTHMPPSDADMRWKTGDGEWQYLNHLADSLTPGTGGGNPLENFVVIPANTFPAAIIYYQFRAYNQDGVASDWSSEAYFTTIDKPQIATPIQPINTIEDADKPILFIWSTSSQSGEASRGADLEYSLDGNSWVAFGHKGETGQQYSLETAESFDSAEGEVIAEPVSESTQTDVIVPEEWSIEDIENDQNKDYYTAPAGLIPPGVIFWHVRSYNRNLSPGEWSEAVSFVAKAAPIVQDLQVTAKPFATVIWQSNDQQNYEIFVDGESLGIFFGTERQYPLPDYLKDGAHTIGLRVLGSFDLWSRIAETQVTIENTPTSTLTLRAPTNIDTALEWTGGSGDFFVYRDGLMIAHTNAHSFTDRTALGEHEYQVVERLGRGDYNQSTVITRSPDVDCLHIAALGGGEWIAIPHRLKNESDPEYSESQEVVYNHLAGIYEPVASIGQYRDDSGKYSAVFLFNEQEEHKRFRALRGKPVILKTADGEVVIGILHAWERKHVLNHYRYAERREIYAAYSFTIQRIGWGDYIDVP